MSCSHAVRNVKQHLIRLATTDFSTILCRPDLAKEFYLWSNTSSRGFGALLEQEGDDGKRHPVAYASRQTNPAEQKYAPTELEVAGLIFAVEHFEVCLIGSTTTVYTDHQHW